MGFDTLTRAGGNSLSLCCVRNYLSHFVRLELLMIFPRLPANVLERLINSPEKIKREHNYVQISNLNVNYHRIVMTDNLFFKVSTYLDT